MKKLLSALAATVLFAHASVAGTIVYTANLTGSGENPSNASPGTGEAIVTIDTIAQTMEVNVVFSGLVGTTTASHIHCCEATPNANVNVGVATATPTFTSFPLGVTSGTYDHLFDLTLASTYNPAFVSSPTGGNGSVATAESVLLAGIANQETYLNIHTSTFAGGEIRGILTPTPEPSALFLAGTALLAVGVFRKKTS